MAKLHSDLSEFVALLNSRSVEYVVVGGHAVAFHGHPRFTGDIDFLVRPTPENAYRVLLVLKDFGFGDLGLTADDLTAPERVVQLGRPPNRICSPPSPESNSNTLGQRGRSENWASTVSHSSVGTLSSRTRSPPIETRIDWT
ncbi:MAG: hypothetical protein ACOY0T_09000 [Myxococcota bacterium]